MGELFSWKKYCGGIGMTECDPCSCCGLEQHWADTVCNNCGDKDTRAVHLDGCVDDSYCCQKCGKSTLEESK